MVEQSNFWSRSSDWFYKARFSSNGETSVNPPGLSDSFCMITAEWIANKMKEMGAAEVLFATSDRRLSSASARGITVSISPEMIPRLVNDTAFRERILRLIRENVKLIEDPRFQDDGRRFDGRFDMSISTFREEWSWSLAIILELNERYYKDGLYEETQDMMDLISEGKNEQSIMDAIARAHAASLARRLELLSSKNHLAQLE